MIDFVSNESAILGHLIGYCPSFCDKTCDILRFHRDRREHLLSLRPRKSVRNEALNHPFCRDKVKRSHNARTSWSSRIVRNADYRCLSEIFTSSKQMRYDLDVQSAKTRVLRMRNVHASAVFHLIAVSLSATQSVASEIAERISRQRA